MNKKTVVYIFAAAAFIIFMFIAVWIYNSAGESYKGTQYIVPNNKKASSEDIESKVLDSGEESDDESTIGVGKDEVQTDNDNLAPDFSVINGEGEELKLSDKFGKPIILNFWATWCGPCRSELPAFEELYKKYGDEIEFMMINLDDSQIEAESFISENNYTFPVVYDTKYEASYIYGASSIPLTVIIYDDGTIYGGKYGAMQKEEIEYYIMDVLEK